LVLIATSITTIYAALVGIIQLQPAVQFIEQHSTFLQVIASFALVITSAHFSNKMYRNTVKMSERPAMVELCRFFISPLEEYLENLTVRKYPILRFREEYVAEVFRNMAETVIEGISPESFFVDRFLMSLKKELHLKFSLSSWRALLVEFYSILEKMNIREFWVREVYEFCKYSNKLVSRIDELEEKLKYLIESHRDEIRAKYETIEEMRRKYTDFQELLDKLVDEFYDYETRKIRGESTEGFSWFYLDDLSNKIWKKLEHYDEEIWYILIERERHKEILIFLLERIREYLRKEYKLAPSEQSPGITP
jgi:hypothetical protein